MYGKHSLPVRPSRSASWPDGLGLPLDALPVAAVGGELGERCVQLDLRGQVAGLLGELERLLVGGAGALVVGLGDLEVVAEGEQRANRLGGIGLARQLDRALEVLAGALGVADAAEHAAEDPVGAAGRRRLAEALGEPQRLLGGVDGEHVVAGVHVQRGGLLVEAHELEAGRAVLEQVDPLLVVLDRALAVALVPEPAPILRCRSPTRARSSWRRWKSRHSLPDLDGLVDTAEPQGDVAELLGDPGARRRVELAAQRQRASRSGRGPPGSSRARRRRRPPPRARQGLAVDRARARDGSSSASRAERGGAAVVLGDQRRRPPRSGRRRAPR